MAKFKVAGTAVTFGRLNKEPVKMLEDFGCEVTLNPYGRPMTEDEMIAYAADADAIIVGNDKVTGRIIEKLKNLKVIAKHGVGIDGIDVITAERLGITVTNAPATNSQEVADLAMGYMLMLARGLYQANADTKADRWIKPTGISLYQKTMGILGTGAIGAALAKRAKGFDMEVLAYDINQNPAALELGVKYVGLEELLAKSDFVSLHLPLVSGTANILNEERLNLMKKGAVLVNTARRQLVDYDALYKLLANNTLRGYAADVFDFEPPAHIPLFDLPNVIITPHIGGTTIESNRRMGETAVANVIAVLSGQTPPNLITSK
jgi:D-3-phosphoglycerate dehydrogenase